MKNVLRFIVTTMLIFPTQAFAVGYKVIPIIQNQQPQSIGAASDDTNQNFIVLKAASSGALKVVTSGGSNAFLNGTVDIPAALSTSRTRMPDREGVYHCTIQADSDNTGSVYVGGSTVTNELGTVQGIELKPYDALSNISVRQNLNDIYVATETAGNDVTYLCN